MKLGDLVIGLVVVPHGKADIGAQGDQHQHAVPENDLPGHPERDIDQGYGGHPQQVALYRARMNGNRGNDRGDAENKQDIGDIAADHVAHGETRRSDKGGVHADYHFGKRCPKTDDGQSDDQRRYAEPLRQRDRAAYDGFAPDKQQGKSGDDEKICHSVG